MVPRVELVWPDAEAVLLHVHGGSGVFLKRSKRMRRRLTPPMTHSCGVVRGGRPFAKKLIPASQPTEYEGPYRVDIASQSNTGVLGRHGYIDRNGGV